MIAVDNRSIAIFVCLDKAAAQGGRAASVSHEGRHVTQPDANLHFIPPEAVDVAVAAL